MRALETASEAALGPRQCVAPGFWRAELLRRSPYHAAYTPDRAVVGFAFDAQVGVHAFASDRRTVFRAKPNGLAYVPAGCDVYSQSDHGGEYLRIVFERERDEPWHTGRRFSDVIDPIAIDAAQRLRRRLLADRCDPLQCESFVQILRQRAAHALGGIAAAPAAGSHMTPRRLSLVDELIEARLDAKITVQELADALGLSAGFFCRAFKAAIGKTPHDHIIDRRISRARVLLEKGELGLSSVALASGFASHAHMTATFRIRLGVAPSELRRRLA